jgi:predicted ATPase/DNA-binding SARP family transcriptional activator
MTLLTLNFLGPVQVQINEKTAAGFDYAKILALLAYLAIESRRPHQRETIAEMLWPGKPERAARSNLRQTLSKLRQAVGDRETAPPFLLISRDTVQFNRASSYKLDTERFTAVFDQIKRHSHTEPVTCKTCMNRLEETAALYRGDFLTGVLLKDSPAFDEWLVIERERFHRKAALAYRYLTTHYERREIYEQALQFARRHVELDNWHEEAHRQLMRLLALTGRRSDALAQYDACRQILQGELGVAPSPDTTALYEQIHAGLIAEKAPGKPGAASLPLPSAPFIGREKELEEITRCLADNQACRLLTLTGPGGIGKTRLALEAAHRIASDRRRQFPHGVYFVSLDGAASPEQMAAAMAAALKLSFTGKTPPQTALLDYLRARETLLVMDNLEHLAADAGFLAEILAQAPDVKILATSRIRLNLHEEWLYPVAGLAYPDEAAADSATGIYEAEQLFAASARRAQPRFALTPATRPAVARICRLLDGLPLGITLAAAWMRSLSCAEIAGELEKGPDLLHTSWRNSPEHHQSLRQVFDRSWALLTEEEQIILCRLSLFRGSFTRPAAEQAAEAGLPALAKLTDHSFLRRNGDNRYQMHPLLQHYAAEKLTQQPGEEQAAAAYSAYYAGFIRRQTAALQSNQIEAALKAIETELDNARQGWIWAARHNRLNEMAQYGKGLQLFLEIRGRYQEGLDLFNRAAAKKAAAAASSDPAKEAQVTGMLRNGQALFHFRLSQYRRAERALQQSLSLPLAEGNGREIRAEAIWISGHVAYGQGRYEEAEKLYRQSRSLFQENGSRNSEAGALNALGVIYRLQGKYDNSQELLQESLDIYQETGNLRGSAVALNNLGSTLRALGSYAEARQCFQKSFTRRKAINDRGGLALTLNNLGNIAGSLQELPAARYLFAESLTICRSMGDRMGIARALNNLGIVAHAEKRYDRAAHYHLESAAIKREIGDRGGLVHSCCHLGQAMLALGDNTQAWNYFQEAARTAAEISSDPLILMSLTEAAALLEKKFSAAFALETLFVVLRHPALSRRMREKAEEGQMQITAALNVEMATAVQEQAAKKSLDDVLQIILA